MAGEIDIHGNVVGSRAPVGRGVPPAGRGFIARRAAADAHAKQYMASRVAPVEAADEDMDTADRESDDEEEAGPSTSGRPASGGTGVPFSCPHPSCSLPACDQFHSTWFESGLQGTWATQARLKRSQPLRRLAQCRPGGKFDGGTKMKLFEYQAAAKGDFLSPVEAVELDLDMEGVTEGENGEEENGEEENGEEEDDEEDESATVANDSFEVDEEVVLFFTERVKRAIDGNISQEAFTAELRAYISDTRVDGAFRVRIAKIDTWAKCMRYLEKGGCAAEVVRYHMCPRSVCGVIFRGDLRNCTQCPKCKAARYLPSVNGQGSRPAKLFHYFPVEDWLKRLWSDPLLAPQLRWPERRAEKMGLACAPDIGSSNGSGSDVVGGPMEDIYDGRVWKECYLGDPILWPRLGVAPGISASVGDGTLGSAVDATIGNATANIDQELIVLANVALQLCADGVSPFKRGGRSFTPITLSCLNLPKWLRDQIETIHLCCIVPGPKAPSDLQPILEVIVDDLMYLYYNGLRVEDASDGAKGLQAAHCRAMLINVISDYRGYPKLFRYTQSPAFVGGCYMCGIRGFRYPPGKKTIYGRYYRWLPRGAVGRIAAAALRFGVPPSKVVLGREATATGDPMSRESLPNPPESTAAYEKSDSTSQAPLEKTESWYRNKAAAAEAHLLGGGKIENYAALHGLQGSHVFWKLPYWQETLMRLPDPMHTIGNEIKALVEMMFGVDFKASVSSRPIEYKDWETRWQELFRRKDNGSDAIASGSNPPPDKKRKKESSEAMAAKVIGMFPFLLTKKDRELAGERLRSIVVEGLVPQKIAYSNVMFAFAQKGYLKTHDWMLLAGPLLKYAIRGLLAPNVERAVFDYVDILSELWAHSYRHFDLPTLQRRCEKALAELELVLPANELDINRHMVIHMVQSICIAGPLKKVNMFPKERAWGKFTKWIKSRKNPEVSIIRTFHVLQGVDNRLRQSEGPWEIEDTYPGYVHRRDSSNVRLYDDVGSKSTKGGLARRTRESWLAELHLYAFKFDVAYRTVWDKFCSATGKTCRNREGKGKPHPEIGILLKEFGRWGLTAEASLTHEERVITKGPVEEVRVFERAEVNGCTFTCGRLESYKKAKDSVVMIKPVGQEPVFGRVDRFLEWRNRSGETHHIVDASWYVTSSQLHTAIRCPTLSRQPKHDNDGNFWACADITPANIILAPDGPNKWIALHQSSDYLTRCHG